MAWTSPRTWVAAEKPPVSTLNTHIRDNFKAIGDAWTTYVPTWTASTTNPTIGNGTLTGAYVAAGKLIHARIFVQFGSTSTVGSGSYSWTLPVTSLGSVFSPGTGLVRDSSAPAFVPRFAYFPNPTTVQLIDTSATVLTHASPYAWASGDSIVIAVTYEGA